MTHTQIVMAHLEAEIIIQIEKEKILRKWPEFQQQAKACHDIQEALAKKFVELDTNYTPCQPK